MQFTATAHHTKHFKFVTDSCSQINSYICKLFIHSTSSEKKMETPLGTRTLILSKLYYGVLSKKLENLETERYYSILHFIKQHNGCCCQQNICDHLHIDKTAMVKVMDALVKAGMVVRKKNPEDRREHCISLTRKGESETREISRTFRRLDKKLFGNISGKDRQAFMNVLNLLTESLNELPKNDLFFNYKKTRK